MPATALSDVSNVSPRENAVQGKSAAVKVDGASKVHELLPPPISNLNDHSNMNAGQKKKKKKKNKKKKNAAKSNEKKEEEVALDLGLVPLKASEEVSNQQGGKTEGETTNEVKQDSGSEAVLEQGNSTGEDVTDDVVAPIIVEFPTPPPGKQQQQSNSEDNNDEGYVVVEDRTDLWSNLGVESSNTPKGVGSLPGPFKAKGAAAEKFVPKSVSPVKKELGRSSIQDFFTDEIKEEVKITLKEEVCTPNVDLLKISGPEEEEEMKELDTPDERKIVRNLTRNSSLGLDFSSDSDSDVPLTVGAPSTSNSKHSAWNNYEFVSKESSSPSKSLPGWTCNSCTFFNSKQHAWVCECCGSAKGCQPTVHGCNAPTLGLGLGGKVNLDRPKSWSCKACSFENEKMNARKCEVCDSKRDTAELGFQMQMEKEVDEEEGKEKGKEKKGFFKKVMSIFKR
ncbi:hypothetical protein TrST_g14346 [Triparma strigata]|uniref:RanBP2-type domain-containing protein n=1 Tax=Triparma strigata TaxID=1606541 RepID=A0A9W7AN37_9STRA|nr:hypothetical protein TrST_g14346 [Triparma strigata]